LNICTPVYSALLVFHVFILDSSKLNFFDSAPQQQQQFQKAAAATSKSSSSIIKEQQQHRQRAAAAASKSSSSRRGYSTHRQTLHFSESLQNLLGSFAPFCIPLSCLCLESIIPSYSSFPAAT
jgi:hypothetical protein